MRVIRPTIRLRLTLWYGGLFLVSSLSVVAVIYGVVDQALQNTPDRVRVEFAEATGATRPGFSGPPPERAALVEDVRASLRDDVLDRLLARSGFIVVMFSVVSLGVGWLIAGRALRPVHRITDTARSLSETNLGARLALTGPDDELKEMADTFDALLARLERAFVSQRQFVASASHELRSPLTVMRARAESPSPNVDLAATVVEQVERADALIDALLTLSRTEGAVLATEQLDLASICGDVLADLAPDADRAGYDLRVDINDAWVMGDAPLIERLIGNLVENAIRHNRTGGRLDVEVGGGAHAFVRVGNDGAELTAEQVARLTEPFTRATDDRTGRGFGMGLAIVDAVARAHGARLTLHAHAGGGLDVAVEFAAVPNHIVPGQGVDDGVDQR